MFYYVSLLPDGTTIQVGSDPEETIYLRGDPTLLRTLVLASQRWPDLAAFVPSRPNSALVCEFCTGSGKLGLIVGSNPRMPGRCPGCAGLGWTLPEPEA